MCGHPLFMPCGDFHSWLSISALEKQRVPGTNGQ
jgi:hypothetical protein